MRAIRVYDPAGNVIETHEHKGDFKDQPLYVAQTVVKQSTFNKIGAILTGLAVLFQVAASLIPSD